MHKSDQEFWDMVALMAIASGRQTATQAANTANELLKLRQERWPSNREEKGEVYGS